MDQAPHNSCLKEEAEEEAEKVEVHRVEREQQRAESGLADAIREKEPVVCEPRNPCRALVAAQVKKHRVDQRWLAFCRPGLSLLPLSWSNGSLLLMMRTAIPSLMSETGVSRLPSWTKDQQVSRNPPGLQHQAGNAEASSPVVGTGPPDSQLLLCSSALAAVSTSADLINSSPYVCIPPLVALLGP